MKVLICLNHGIDKSLLLGFDDNLKAKDLKRLVENYGQEAAVEMLISESTTGCEILPQNLKKAKITADFTISQAGYIAERLA